MHFASKVKVKVLVDQLCPTLRVPLSVRFSRQEFPSPGYLSNPGIEPGSSTLQADSLQSEPPGKPFCFQNSLLNSLPDSLMQLA